MKQSLNLIKYQTNSKNTSISVKSSIHQTVRPFDYNKKVPMIQWKCLSFYDLNLDDLYAIMRLRQEVFVVEQDCPYLDADDKDQEGWHMLGISTTGEYIAYARLLPKGIAYPNEAAIGRVLTSEKVRGTGLGKILMKESIKHAKRLFGEDHIHISAQSYLIKFYKSFGFRVEGEGYLEDGIPHQGMLLV